MVFDGPPEEIRLIVEKILNALGSDSASIASEVSEDSASESSASHHSLSRTNKKARR